MGRSGCPRILETGVRRRKGLMPVLEPVEHRLCLSTTAVAPLPTGSGVDSMAMGDFNADRVADIAVASRQNGQFIVTIYSGSGQTASTSTGFAPMPLATIVNPLGRGVGPLDVAAGDFTGAGVSDLAISSTGTGRAASSKVAVYTFTLVNSTPMNSPVTPVLLGQAFVPPGMGRTMGLNVAAADTDVDGESQLIVAPAHRGPNRIGVLSYSPATKSWQSIAKIGNVPLPNGGMSLDAGQIAGDGSTEIVAGSSVNGQVAVYDTALGRWLWSTKAFGAVPGGVQVAAVSAVGTSGSVVVTTASGRRKPMAAIIPWNGSGAVRFQPVTSPGAGALVALGGGYVYQRSTMQGLDTPFPFSDGPTTPTVFLASTRGSQLIVQGFTASNAPSTPDTYVEPLWGNVGAGFIPLQPNKDPDSTGGSSDASSLDSIATNLVIYPQQLTYNSPYGIDLSGVPASVFAGLYNITSMVASTPSAWGPAAVQNVAPSPPTTDTAGWLQQRLLAAYASAIGLDYQHHYVPTWLPQQGTVWNMTSTVAYQSRGIDCTNLTAYAYADALGIQMTGDTTQQGLISGDNLNGTVIPKSLTDSGAVSVSTLVKGQWTSYANLISQLHPGDILYIHGNPSDPTQITHAITWLGIYGVDKNGQKEPLIIDSTGITPAHINSNNQVIPEGVEIRPFGPPGSVNGWYYENLDHVLRFINPPAS